MAVLNPKEDESSVASFIKNEHDESVVLAAPESATGRIEEGYELHRGLRARHITMIGIPRLSLPCNVTKLMLTKPSAVQLELA